jgi:hypothetical protein
VFLSNRELEFGSTVVGNEYFTFDGVSDLERIRSMTNSAFGRALAAGAVPTGILLILLLGGPSLVAAKPPTMAEVKAVVERHLRSNPDYAPGDLISRGDVEPIFDELLPLGVPLNESQEELYDDFVPDNSPLVCSLRTPRGREFMKKVKSFPKVYDRLERLSWSPKGKEMIDQLIEDPQGPALFNAMLQPSGLAATAKYLNDDPSGKNFSLATGRIHTANELLKRLEAVVARKKVK